MNNVIKELAEQAGYDVGASETNDKKLSEFARLLLRETLIELGSVAIEMRQKGWSVEASCFESSCETIVDHFNIKFVDSPGTYIKFTEKDDIKCD